MYIAMQICDIIAQVLNLIWTCEELADMGTESESSHLD